MSGHLALVLPGGGAGPYTAPLLLPTLAAEQLGAQVEVVPYPAFRPAGLGHDEAAAFDAFVVDRVRELLAARTWSRVTFVAKSRGTLFLSTMDESVVPCDDVEALWITPLLGFDYVREGVLAKGWPSLLVAGSADAYHDPSAHEQVAASLGAVSLVVERANHGLVVEGDVLATVESYRALAEASLTFLARRAPASTT